MTEIIDIEEILEIDFGSRSYTSTEKKLLVGSSKEAGYKD